MCNNCFGCGLWLRKDHRALSAPAAPGTFYYLRTPKKMERKPENCLRALEPFVFGPPCPKSVFVKNEVRIEKIDSVTNSNADMHSLVLVDALHLYPESEVLLDSRLMKFDHEK